MNAALIAQLINAGFAIINGMRQLGFTTADINLRLERVDQGGEAITIDEVQAKLDALKAEIDAGRAMP